MNHDETRKYIHDLANSFSIIDASVSRALSLLSKNHPELVDEIQKIKKADEYIKKSVQTLRDLRLHIHNAQSEKTE